MKGYQIIIIRNGNEKDGKLTLFELGIFTVIHAIGSWEMQVMPSPFLRIFMNVMFFLCNQKLKGQVQLPETSDSA